MGTARRRNDGFLERGDQVTRLETFVDAAFAFAVTLLIISAGTLPSSGAELIEAFKGTPAFVLSFVLLAQFWWSHNTWSRRYGLDDTGSNIISLALVCLVLLWVYPLRAMMESFFAWVTAGWLPARYGIRSFADLTTMFVTYGAMFATVGVCFALLYLQAWRQRATLALDATEREATVAAICSFLWIAINGIGSLLLALVLIRPDRPTWVYAVPGTMYFSLWATGPLVRAIARRIVAPTPG